MFAFLDRPVRSLATLARAPAAYNARPSLTAASFWRTAVGTGALHGAITFFVPYLSSRTRGAEPALDDVWALGKTCLIGIIGVVSLEIALVARYWTAPFAAAVLGSYFATWPWLAALPLLYRAAGKWDVAQSGVGVNLLSAPLFWMQLLLIYTLTFSTRVAERGFVWLFRPRDDMILAEMEAVVERDAKAEAADGGKKGEQA
jgi:Phospholipid-translocating P-type ATPase C-terminal